MALVTDFHPVAVQSGFYIGNAADNSVLTRIWEKRTGGLNIIDKQEKEFLVGINQWAFIGLREVTLTANFINDSQTIYNFANNIPLSATGLNSYSDPTYTYTVAIVDKLTGSDKCYVLNGVGVTGGRRIPYSKDNPTIISVTMQVIERDPSQLVLWKGKYSDLITYLGVRSPVS